MSFIKDAWLSPDGRNEISGQQLVYNIRTQSFGRQRRPSGDSGSSGRVRIVIQPGKPPTISPEKEKKP